MVESDAHCVIGITGAN